MTSKNTDTQACIPDDKGSSSIEEITGGRLTPNPSIKKNRLKGCIIWPLLPLRASLFFFFGGLGCLLVFLPLHMREVGLSKEHLQIISIIAPIVSILGPLVVGPAADRLGKHKVLLTGCIILSAATYCLLLAVPVSEPQGQTSYEASSLEQPPSVILKCDPNYSDNTDLTHLSAILIQEKCASKCSEWGKHQKWDVNIFNCKLNCDGSAISTTTSTPTTLPDTDYESEVSSLDQIKKKINPITDHYQARLPYICLSNPNESALCGPYNITSKPIKIDAVLSNVTSTETQCLYPLDTIHYKEANKTYSQLKCRRQTGCTVTCQVSGGLWNLSENKCPASASLTDPKITLWSYVLARCIADIFPVSALALVGTLVVLLTHDHHSDVGKELSWGALGAAIFVPAVGGLVLLEISPWPETPSALPILVSSFLCLIAAIPLSAVKQQSSWYSRRMEIGGRPGPPIHNKREAFALFLVLILLGFFWGTLDSYLPWVLTDANDSLMIICLTVTIGCLISFPILWKSELIIDYCGHTNLFIVAFAFYIIRFTGFGFMDGKTWLGIAFESFEVFTLCLMWTSAVLYAKTLFAQHVTGSGQAMIVIGHFCIGRFLGSLMIYILNSYGAWTLYQGCALAAAIIGWLYFCFYYCILRPGCGRKKVLTYNGDATTDRSTTNGTYIPIRPIYNGGGGGNDNEQQKREMRY